MAALGIARASSALLSLAHDFVNYVGANYVGILNHERLVTAAIQSAGVSRGRNGFRKDKSGEKLAESEEDLLEHRTDGSDAFDNLYIGCEKFPQSHVTGFAVGGVI